MRISTTAISYLSPFLQTDRALLPLLPENRQSQKQQTILFPQEPANLLPLHKNARPDRNKICQIDVFCSAEFGKLKSIHYSIDTYPGFQLESALNSEKADSVIVHYSK